MAAARVATCHLLSLGRRRIAVIGGPAMLRDEVLRLRLAGYQEALAEAGIPVDERLVVPIHQVDTLSFRADGAEAMSRLLSLSPPPDAVFGFNDLLALGALKTLLSSGYRIPDDVAVVGFDNIEAGRFATPTLTTIAPNIEEIADSAVSLLLRRIHGSDEEPSFVQPSFELIVRASTCGQSAGPASGDP